MGAQILKSWQEGFGQALRLWAGLVQAPLAVLCAFMHPAPPPRRG